MQRSCDEKGNSGERWKGNSNERLHVKDQRRKRERKDGCLQGRGNGGEGKREFGCRLLSLNAKARGSRLMFIFILVHI